MTAAEIATPTVSAGIERLILDFLAYLELERGLSRNTLEAYRSDLLQFGEFLDRHGLEPTEAAHGELAEFLSELARGRRGASAGAPRRTLARKVACLRSFYRHLRREGMIEHDPTAELRGPAQAPAPAAGAHARGGRPAARAAPRRRARWRCATGRCWR